VLNHRELRPGRSAPVEPAALEDVVDGLDIDAVAERVGDPADMVPCEDLVDRVAGEFPDLETGLVLHPPTSSQSYRSCRDPAGAERAVRRPSRRAHRARSMHP